jgi:aspartate/methionine/tyrosine aminotransferase
VAPGVAFGPGGEGHVRFSLIEPDDRVQKAGAQIAKLLAS